MPESPVDGDGGRAFVPPHLSTMPMYMVLCPAGHPGVFMDFRITTDLELAADTAHNIGGLVARLEVVHIHRNSGGRG